MQVKKIKRKTIAQKIAEKLIDRKILHFRYDAHLRQQVYSQLNSLQKKLLNRLATGGVDALPKRQLHRLLSDLKQTINATYQTISQQQADELSAFFVQETQALSALYNGEIGYDLFTQIPAYKLQAMKNTPLIAGTPLEDWWAKQANDYRLRFEGLVRQGLLDGKQTAQIITEIRELTQTQRRHAETLVITAVGKVADNAHQALRDENEDLLNGEQHLSTLDLRTSSTCQLRDGLRWDIHKKPVGHHIPYQRPPLHPRCRSVLQLWLKSWKELGIDIDEEPEEGTRASATGEVKGNLHYEEWLKGKSLAEQDAVLGKGKADLWRRGVITFRDMLDQTGRPLSLAQLKRMAGNSSVITTVEQLSDFAITKEPDITMDMISIIDKVGGKAVGLDFRLKSLSSLKRKIETEMLFGCTKEQAIQQIRDVIRYTTVFDVQDFANRYAQMQDLLSKQGYQTIVVKNTWKENAAYKGINTFIEKGGVIFEMQYHTQQSFELKNGELHQLYERFRDVSIPIAEKNKLFLEMQKLSANLKEPEGITKIKEKK